MLSMINHFVIMRRSLLPCSIYSIDDNALRIIVRSPFISGTFSGMCIYVLLMGTCTFRVRVYGAEELMLSHMICFLSVESLDLPFRRFHFVVLSGQREILSREMMLLLFLNP